MHQKSRERGVALIAVLWTLLLLSALASAAAYVARGEAILTHKLGESAQAESSTDAAVINAIALLSDEMTSRHPPLDAQSPWDFQGNSVTVFISHEDGRIDLNTADDELITAFLYSQNVSPDEAALMLGDLRKAQNVTHGPAPPGSLRTIEEVEQLPRWSEHLNCWKSALTVYTGLPSVNSVDAPAQVDAALKWTADHHWANRDWASANATIARQSATSTLGEVLRIVAATSAHSNVVARTEWIGRLTGDIHQPTLTMKWGRMTSASNSSCKNNVK